MRLAAIDLGSNSVHMVIADVSPDGHLEIVERVKEMARLGGRSFNTGVLAPPAMELAIRALTHFKRLSEIRAVERMRAVATSAVREARNRADFIARIQRETGIRVEIISGPQEARLIYGAARRALALDGGPHLLVDIGGGSVELVLVKDRRALWLKSVKLGAARLTERFLSDDPPTPAARKRLAKHLEKEIGALMRSARRARVVRAIGTSGTINTLIAMAQAARGEDTRRLHGASASLGEIRRLCRTVVETNPTRRLALAGMDAKRVEQMPAAAMLTDFVLRRSGAAEIVACSWALREGLLLRMAQAAYGTGTTAPARRRSITALATRFAGSNQHGRHVAQLALRLFDGTALMLQLPQSSRELLEYAALLHDIGHAIDHDRHNRHSYYLVRNAELLGFEPVEIEMIALAALSHRKQAAQLDSPEWRVLSPSRRRVVRGMAALLRLADGLDRSHCGVVDRLDVVSSPQRVVIEVGSRRKQADLELWTGERRTELLAKLLERPVILQV